MTEYLIPTEGDMPCKCGRMVRVDMSGDKLVIECVCGWRSVPFMPLACALSLLGAMGIVLSLDWDGQLIVSSDREVPDEVLGWLFSWQISLRNQLTSEARSRG